MVVVVVVVVVLFFQRRDVIRTLVHMIVYHVI